MTRLGFCTALVLAGASIVAAQAPAPQRANAAPTRPHAFRPPETFEKYCFECHGASKKKGGVSLDRLIRQSSQSSVGAYWDDWNKVADMLETGQMPPPDDAESFPTDAERAATAAWVRSTLSRYETEHAGDPGRVTVRRLTSAEYGYAIRDLTGIDITVGPDASSDSVGGEGFTNFGDVQFVEDTRIERYLEAAKLAADHAVVGAGPLQFYADAGDTGLELSALSRINALYAAKGFRVVSGEGGRPFGLDRYGKALFVAWYYRHRAALGDPSATIRSLAEKEGISGRFAEHIWLVVNRANTGYPTRATVDGWRNLPAPTSDVAAALVRARAGCDDLQKALTTWPSWFFARGDLAAGGAGDESPLVFDDTSLKAASSHTYAYPIGMRGGRGRGGASPSTPGPAKVYLTFTDVNPTVGVAPVIIWRNPRIVTRAVAAPGPAAQDSTAVAATGAGRGRGLAGPILSSRPLRQALPADGGETLAFGTSPDGTAMGAGDFATTGTVTFTIDVPPGAHVIEFHAEAELGRDRNAVVRVAVSDRAEGSARDASQRVILGEPTSAGYEGFRANIAEYVSLLPPNSHGEANPADKDPVPAPFDNTYNSPEHDAFVLGVKYQRNDRFFTDNVVDGEDRERLDQAWNDLFGSWPYHDAYLGMLADHFAQKLPTRKIAEVSPTLLASLPPDVRPHVRALRTHYDAVTRAQALARPRHVADALAFASRAWRRPLTPIEKSELRAFYLKSLTVHRLDHDASIRGLLARILMSPAFLYRLETVPRGPERPLSGWEIASRMSFFLWSSIPDQELRRAAAAGELTDPAMLAKQVKRMTADPKARRLATEFFGQWLGFYHFDEYRGVDTTRFPEFTEAVKSAMYDESISTFEYIVRKDRPLREMLFADYAFLNQPLATFYGIDRPVASHDKVEMVPGAGAFNRGGALRLGSVLTTTSAPLRTSPVKRGDWVLRRILGTPTPPPPADAGSIPADDRTFNGLTVRERLAEHKRNATCANCHLRIDPLGFPLEGFDAVGRVRGTYTDGKPVDVTGEFADKTTIVGTDGLLAYLGTQDKQVMTTLSKKMIGYALGRTVRGSDRPLLDAMASAGGQRSFADLAVTIVTSRQFRNRVGDGGAPAAPAAPSSDSPASAPLTGARVAPSPSTAGIQ